MTRIGSRYITTQATDLAIGDPVSGAASGDILFIDSALNLAKDSLLKFDETNKRMSIGEAIGGTARVNIKGFGATSATKSVSIKNGSNIEFLSIFDDQTATFTGAFTVQRPSPFTTQIKINPASESIEFTTAVARLSHIGFPRIQLNTTQTNIAQKLTVSEAVTVVLNAVLGAKSTSVGDVVSEFRGRTGQTGSLTKWTIDGTGTVAELFKDGSFKVGSGDTAAKNAIPTPTAGQIFFDTTLAKLCVYTGAAWETITSV